MLENCRLINFQSHADTFIEFSNGLNCIIGSGDVGKSALVRALRWVLFNETPKGEFITWGKTKSAVSIGLTKGIEIVRGREGKRNFYKLIVDGSEKLFENFGLEIPVEISAILNTISLNIDIDTRINLNVVGQHDGLFLLDKSGSIKNKAINSVIGMQYIDAVIRDLSPEIKKFDSQKEKYETEIQELKTQIEQVGYKAEDEKKIERLKQDNKKLEELNKRTENIKSFIDDLCNIETKIKEVNDKKSKFPKVEDVEKHEKLTDRYIKLYNYIKTVKEFEIKEQELNKKKKSYEKITEKDYDRMIQLIQRQQVVNNIYKDWIEFEEKEKAFKVKKAKYEKFDTGLLEKMEGLIDRYSKIDTLYKIMDDFAKKFTEFKAKKNEVVVNIQKAKDSLLQTVKDMKMCPVCYSEIDEKKAEEIVERS